MNLHKIFFISLLITGTTTPTLPNPTLPNPSFFRSLFSSQVDRQYTRKNDCARLFKEMVAAKTMEGFVTSAHAFLTEQCPQTYDLNTFTQDGQTLLTECINHKNINVMKLLVEQGADINQLNKEGFSPLMWATYKGSFEMVKALIELGASINKVYKDGFRKTPLMIAVSRGDTHIVSYLLSQGADVNYINSQGFTALTFARNEGIKNILIAAGAQ